MQKNKRRGINKKRVAMYIIFSISAIVIIYALSLYLEENNFASERSSPGQNQETCEKGETTCPNASNCCNNSVEYCKKNADGSVEFVCIENVSKKE